jgi:hypothetical protein
VPLSGQHGADVEAIRRAAVSRQHRKCTRPARPGARSHHNRKEA